MDEKEQVKVCAICGVEKPITEFHKSNCGKYGVRTKCKQCRAAKKEILPIGKRRCSCCNLIKNVVDFYNRNDGGTRFVCKDCMKKKDSKYRKNYRRNKSHVFAWRELMKRCVKRMDTEKTDKTINMLGYSADDLKKHIESLFTEDMSWGNYGEWHIDHIKPLSSFDKGTPPNVVNALDNLQPLWATTREINGVVYEGNLNKWAN